MRPPSENKIKVTKYCILKESTNAFSNHLLSWLLFFLLNRHMSRLKPDNPYNFIIHLLCNVIYVVIQALHWPALGSSTSATENTPSVHVIVSIQALGLACPWGIGRIHHQLQTFCMYMCYIPSQKVRPIHCLLLFFQTHQYKSPLLCLPLFPQ